MELQDKLLLLKMDLQITTTAYDELLAHTILSAESFIEREGVTLDSSSVEDAQLVIMYAAWMFRKRRDENPAMPRMLRWALNNRLFSQKAGAADA